MSSATRATGEMGSSESSPCPSIPAPAPLPAPRPAGHTTDIKPDLAAYSGTYGDGDSRYGDSSNGALRGVKSENRALLSGAVTSESQLASDIGKSILARGGNAVDAIIATVIAVNTLCPYHSDIGGGGFALIRLPNGRYESLDFRHVAPAAASSEFYRNPKVSTSIGGAAVAVPGELRGLEELHRRHGRLAWRELFEGSIEIAEKGVAVGRDLHLMITSTFTTDSNQSSASSSSASSKTSSWMSSDPNFAVQYLVNGKAIEVGTTYRRPEYARVLRQIAECGADVFYTGEIARALVAVVRDRGGLISLDDLANYRPRWNTPLSTRYKDYTLWAPPAPASGAVWLSAMGILSHYSPTDPGDSLDLHRLTEALRLAYGQRTALGDPAYVPGLEEKQREWLRADKLAERARMIDDGRTFPPDYYKPPKVEIVEDHGTSNITVADSDGLVVSITTTVGLGWGSRIMVPGHGFVLNDSMDDFSVEGRTNAFGYEPQVANYVHGGKRPLSSSCPYIIENDRGQVVLAGGAAGGSTIISTNAQVALGVLAYNLTATQALDKARLHNQILPNVTLLEQGATYSRTVHGFSEDQKLKLEAKGHKIEWIPKARNTACAIRFSYDQGGMVDWDPAGEPRKYDSGASVFRS